MKLTYRCECWSWSWVDAESAWRSALRGTCQKGPLVCGKCGDSLPADPTGLADQFIEDYNEKVTARAQAQPIQQ